MRALMPLFLLAACSGGSPVLDLEVSECLNPEAGPDDEVPTEELLLSSGQQELTVAHRAHELNCAHEVDVRFDLDEDARTIDVTYDDRSKEPANCTCVFDLAYRIEELADGAWTVKVPGNLQAEGLVD